MEATWRRRELSSPDGRWTLHLIYAGEPRMGMDIYRLALHEAGRDVSADHPALAQDAERGWWRYLPTQPWSADSRFVAVATWGGRGSREMTHLYDVIDRQLRPCPFNAYRAEASPTRPHFLLARQSQAIVVSTSMKIQIDVSVARPGDHPYWQWLPSGNAFLHVPGWGSRDGPLTLFDAPDGSVISQLRLDCEEIVPYEPQPSRVFSDGDRTLTWSDAVARKQCPPQWSTAYFNSNECALYLGTSRPEGEPFLVKPPPPKEGAATHPLIVFLDIVLWVLSKISRQELPQPKQIPASLRCKTREEWVGVRMKEE